jgi:hypothetical protein
VNVVDNSAGPAKTYLEYRLDPENPANFSPEALKHSAFTLFSGHATRIFTEIRRSIEGHGGRNELAVDGGRTVQSAFGWDRNAESTT